MYYTPKQVAEIYNITRLTVYRWIKANKINYIRVGNGYKISKEHLEEFIKRSNEVS